MDTDEGRAGTPTRSRSSARESGDRRHPSRHRSRTTTQRSTCSRPSGSRRSGTKGSESALSSTTSGRSPITCCRSSQAPTVGDHRPRGRPLQGRKGTRAATLEARRTAGEKRVPLGLSANTTTRRSSGSRRSWRWQSSTGCSRATPLEAGDAAQEHPAKPCVRSAGAADGPTGGLGVVPAWPRAAAARNACRDGPADPGGARPPTPPREPRPRHTHGREVEDRRRSARRRPHPALRDELALWLDRRCSRSRPTSCSRR